MYGNMNDDFRGKTGGVNQDAAASFWKPALFIVLFTFLTYLPALQCDFVNWDDGRYVYENTHIKSLDLAFFRWLPSAIVGSNWHPLTVFSHALDYAFFGPNPAGHHFSSIVLHTLNTFLVFLISLKLLRLAVKHHTNHARKNHFILMASASAALLFGLHPMHVESVVWVSERKDVLCAFFYLLAISLYLNHAHSNTPPQAAGHAPARNSITSSSYLLSLTFYAFSIMSKPMAVSLPVILLLLDYYPLNRIKTGNPDRMKPVFFEKIPFFIIAFILSAVTLWTQYQSGALKVSEAPPLFERTLVAVKAVILYPAKMALPVNLAPYYPYPENISLFDMSYMLSFLLFAIITLISIKWIKRRPWLAIIWFCYLITLFPVSGILQVGKQAAADRYIYLPGISLILLAGIGLSQLMPVTGSGKRRIVLTLSTLLLLLMSGKTVMQTGIWKDSHTLWSHEIDLFPNTADIAYLNRGTIYDSTGNYDDALIDYDRAIAINPTYVKAYLNRGLTHGKLNNPSRATKDLSEAIRLDPKNVKALINRGIAFGKVGNHGKGIEDLTRAMEIDSDSYNAYLTRGTLFYLSGSHEMAREDYIKATEIDPSRGDAYYNLGLVNTKLGHLNEARQLFRKAADAGLVEAEMKLTANKQGT